MGCIFPKLNKHKDEEKKCEPENEISNEVDAKPLDPKDFMIEYRKGETLGRTPGKIRGQQFIINNCENCDIYLFDHIATITIDDCSHCRIFVGPTRGSLYIRDCVDCKLVAACQQFRTRDCRKIDTFLMCASQPVIESSTAMRFGCFRFYYPELEEQFHKAQLSVYNNNWSNVHDFTPVPGETNFSLLPEDMRLEDVLPLPTAVQQFTCMQICLDPGKSPVPRTLGTRKKSGQQACLIVFFNDGGQHYRAKKFIEQMKAQPHCCLVQCKELTMQPDDALRVFSTNSYRQAVQLGPVIGFEYCGDNCIYHCQHTVIDVLQGSTGLVFVSNNPKTSQQQIDNFYNYADMQMGM